MRLLQLYLLRELLKPRFWLVTFAVAFGAWALGL